MADLAQHYVREMIDSTSKVQLLSESAMRILVVTLQLDSLISRSRGVCRMGIPRRVDAHYGMSI
jgi:hypothetical protein